MKVGHKQEGLALIVLVFVIALVAISYYVRAIKASEINIQRNSQTVAALAEAKAALIGWSISHPTQPGIMPFPDRSADGNYDGNSDCSNMFPSLELLIGRLPNLGQTSPCSGSANGLATNLRDGNGEQLWYAVSRNLIRTSTVPLVNPSIADNPPEDWLIVLDKNGQVISNRIAAVIIAPGAPVGSQSRAGGLAGPAAYLDSISVGGNTFSNANYDRVNEDFIISDDMRNVLPTDPLFSHPYQYNDRLIFITIDELITHLEQRVAQEVIVNLNSYYQSSATVSADRYYPYAADSSFNCIDGLLGGALPVVGDCTTAAGLSTFPSWFNENSWQNFFYYTISSECSNNGPLKGCASGEITAGTEINLNAIIIATGPELSQTEFNPTYNQNRPSNDVRDYLDSSENTNGDNVYDSAKKVKSAVYNDRIFILQP